MANPFRLLSVVFLALGCTVPQFEFADDVAALSCGWTQHVMKAEPAEISSDECLQVYVVDSNVKLSMHDNDLCTVDSLPSCIVTDDPYSMRAYTETYDPPAQVKFLEVIVGKLSDGSCPDACR